MTSSETSPAVGEILTYVTATSNGPEHRNAVVAGVPEDPASEHDVHLAVLAANGLHLDLLALSVPHDAHASGGSWHRNGATWPVGNHVEGHVETVGAVQEHDADG